jgi:hypothetical protein
MITHALPPSTIISILRFAISFIAEHSGGTQRGRFFVFTVPLPSRSTTYRIHPPLSSNDGALRHLDTGSDDLLHKVIVSGTELIKLILSHLNELWKKILFARIPEIVHEPLPFADQLQTGLGPSIQPFLLSNGGPKNLAL